MIALATQSFISEEDENAKIYNVGKYILQVGLGDFAIWTNILYNLDKYTLQFGQIQ